MINVPPTNLTIVIYLVFFSAFLIIGWYAMGGNPRKWRTWVATVLFFFGMLFLAVLRPSVPGPLFDIVGSIVVIGGLFTIVYFMVKKPKS